MKGPNTPSDILERLRKGYIKKIKVTDVMKSSEINTTGKNSFLNRDKEALIIAKAHMEADHGVGVSRLNLGRVSNPSSKGMIQIR